MTQHFVPGPLEPVEVAVDGFVRASLRQGKVLVVGLRGFTRWSLIDHEVTTACLDRDLKSLYGFLDPREVFRLLRSTQPDAEGFEPVGDFLGNTLNVIGGSFFAGMRHNCSTFLVRIPLSFTS
jgi:hypothetical protein